jgi:hypothetical protein
MHRPRAASSAAATASGSRAMGKTKKTSGPEVAGGGIRIGDKVYRDEEDDSDYIASDTDSDADVGIGNRKFVPNEDLFDPIANLKKGSGILGGGLDAAGQAAIRKKADAIFREMQREGKMEERKRRREIAGGMILVEEGSGGNGSSSSSGGSSGGTVSGSGGIVSGSSEKRAVLNYGWCTGVVKGGKKLLGKGKVKSEAKTKKQRVKKSGQKKKLAKPKLKKNAKKKMDNQTRQIYEEMVLQKSGDAGKQGGKPPPKKGVVKKPSASVKPTSSPQQKVTRSSLSARIKVLRSAHSKPVSAVMKLRSLAGLSRASLSVVDEKKKPEKKNHNAEKKGLTTVTVSGVGSKVRLQLPPRQIPLCLSRGQAEWRRKNKNLSGSRSPSKGASSLAAGVSAAELAPRSPEPPPLLDVSELRRNVKYQLANVYDTQTEREAFQESRQMESKIDVVSLTAEQRQAEQERKEKETGGGGGVAGSGATSGGSVQTAGGKEGSKGEGKPGPMWSAQYVGEEF